MDFGHAKILDAIFSGQSLLLSTVEPRLSEPWLSKPSIIQTLELCVLLEYLPIYYYNCKFVTWPTFITIIQH